MRSWVDVPGHARPGAGRSRPWVLMSSKAVTSDAAGFRWEKCLFAGDFRPRGPGLSLRRIVVPRGVSRKPAQAGGHRSVEQLVADARVAAERVVRELELVAPAKQDPERAVAVAGRGRRLGEAAGEDRQRRLELLRGLLLADDGGHELAVDAEREQLALDPLGAPAVEPAAVIREPLGVARVVEVALLAQLGDHGLDRGRLDPLGRQQAGQLGDRALAPV